MTSTFKVYLCVTFFIFLFFQIRSFKISKIFGRFQIWNSELVFIIDWVSDLGFGIFPFSFLRFKISKIIQK